MFDDAAVTPPIRPVQTGDGGSSWSAFGSGFLDTVGKLYLVKKQADVLKSGNPNAYALADQYNAINQPLVDNQTAGLSRAARDAQLQAQAQASNVKQYLLIGGALLLGAVLLKKVLK